MSNIKTKKEEIRVSGRLREIITVKDEKGKIIHRFISPLMVEFHFKDVLQVLVGSTILAIPVGFTEEVWLLGDNLPIINILAFLLISIFFVGLFIYHNFYHDRLDKYRNQFYKRVGLTYSLSFVVVAVFLSLIGKAPWTTDFILAFNRVVLVTLPASMSAAVADTIK